MKLQYNFTKVRGGSKAVWNFSENWSDLVAPTVHKWAMVFLVQKSKQWKRTRNRFSHSTYVWKQTEIIFQRWQKDTIWTNKSISCHLLWKSNPSHKVWTMATVALSFLGHFLFHLVSCECVFIIPEMWVMKQVFHENKNKLSHWVRFIASAFHQNPRLALTIQNEIKTLTSSNAL